MHEISDLILGGVGGLATRVVYRVAIYLVDKAVEKGLSWWERRKNR